jgi:hypothetical protein
MSLEDKSCSHCKRKFEDGNILIKNEENYYHHSDSEFVTPLMAIMSCSLIALDNGKVGIFYKERFYDLQKNSDKLGGINVTFKDMTDGKGIIYGHSLIGDISFLDKLNPD